MLLRVGPHGLFSWLFLPSSHLLPFSFSLPLFLLPLPSSTSSSARLSLTQSGMSSSTTSLRNSWEEELESLRLLRQASPQVESTSHLVETFLHMVRERTGEQLDAWLGAVQASHLQAFQSFVTGVQQDKDAVLAGLTLPWSNGPLEGHVNRLKLMKRSMYGRAEFDLLKLRVLYQSKKHRDRKNKKKNNQAQQVGHLKKPKIMKSGTNSQHTTTGISEVA